MFVWDAHAGFAPSAREIEQLSCWHSAGVGYVSVNVGYDVLRWHETVHVLAAYRSFVARSDRYVLAQTYDDLDAAESSGRLAVGFDLEGLNSLDGDIRLIEAYRALGVRQMLLAYNLNNRFAGGCHDSDTGLTRLGRLAVAEMNRVGVLVDCSHVGLRSSLDIIAASEKPTVFSHSNCWAVHRHGRNITDEQIRACAETGGVIGINGVSGFLGRLDPIDAIVRHVAHVAELVGPAHVGLGLDATIADGPARIGRDTRYWPAECGYDTPMTFVQPASFERIAAALVTAGFTSQEVSLVMGENFARVAREVWCDTAR
jgi:membrane dipeptidase